MFSFFKKDNKKENQEPKTWPIYIQHDPNKLADKNNPIELGIYTRRDKLFLPSCWEEIRIAFDIGRSYYGGYGNCYAYILLKNNNNDKTSSILNVVEYSDEIIKLYDQHEEHLRDNESLLIKGMRIKYISPLVFPNDKHRNIIV